MGVFGYPAVEAVPILVKTALQAKQSFQHLKEIRFVVTTDDLLDLFRSAIGHPAAPGSIKVWRAHESDIGDTLGGWHVLTYAEEGFSPLSSHANRFDFSRPMQTAFADAVNQRGEVGSMHPRVPISALPRTLVRDQTDPEPLAASLTEFFQFNTSRIKACRLVFDFRTPAVPRHAIAALQLTLERTDPGPIQEILILE